MDTRQAIAIFHTYDNYDDMRKALKPLKNGFAKSVATTTNGCSIMLNVLDRHRAIEISRKENHQGTIILMRFDDGYAFHFVNNQYGCDRMTVWMPSRAAVFSLESQKIR